MSVGGEAMNMTIPVPWRQQKTAKKKFGRLNTEQYERERGGGHWDGNKGYG